MSDSYDNDSDSFDYDTFHLIEIEHFYDELETRLNRYSNDLATLLGARSHDPNFRKVEPTMKSVDVRPTDPSIPRRISRSSDRVT